MENGNALLQPRIGNAKKKKKKLLLAKPDAVLTFIKIVYKPFQ